MAVAVMFAKPAFGRSSLKTHNTCIHTYILISDCFGSRRNTCTNRTGIHDNLLESPDTQAAGPCTTTLKHTIYIHVHTAAQANPRTLNKRIVENVLCIQHETYEKDCISLDVRPSTIMARCEIEIWGPPENDVVRQSFSSNEHWHWCQGMAGQRQWLAVLTTLQHTNSITCASQVKRVSSEKQ